MNIENNNKIKILCFGSCRSTLIPSNKYKIINFIYTHTTKEVIQLLLYSYSNIEKQKNILSNEFILVNMTIEKFKNIKELCDNCDIILIEISSIKEIINNNGYYFNQWVVRDNIINKKPNIEKNIKIKIASVNDLKQDIKFIKNFFPETKKIIFQSHINLNFEGLDSLKNIKIIPPIESRTIIDNAINESSNIIKLIPRNIFKDYNWKDILLSNDDTCHLSKKGYDILALALDNI
jgi:hypothetical protein